MFYDDSSLPINDMRLIVNDTFILKNHNG